VSDTRRKLIDGAIETLRARGIAGTSARVIATAAGSTKHWSSTTSGPWTAWSIRPAGSPLPSACHCTATGSTAWGSLRELLALGRELDVAERSAGNVAVLAQVLAGAQQEPGLAAAARHSLGLWEAEIGAVLRRVLAGSSVSDLVAATDLASAVAWVPQLIGFLVRVPG